jgi:hypothetical protein
MKDKQKELKREYKHSHRRMGVWQIRNLVSDKALIGTALNLEGILNRHQFALKMGTHQNHALQADWNEFWMNSLLQMNPDTTTAPISLSWKSCGWKRRSLTTNAVTTKEH